LSLGDNALPTVILEPLSDYDAVILPSKDLSVEQKSFPLSVKKKTDEEDAQLINFIPEMVNIVHGESLNKRDASKLIRKSFPELKVRQVDKFLADCTSRVGSQLVATPSKLRLYNCPENVIDELPEIKKADPSQSKTTKPR